MSQSELGLINQVELRIALAATDVQLESALKVYLPPLLLKLASSYAESRQAVFRIIQQIVPRITAARTIQLPVLALLQQAKQPKVAEGLDTSSVRLYSLLFVSKGIDRLDTAGKCEIVPLLIDGISASTKQVASRLFNILCKILSSIDAPGMNNFEQLINIKLIKPEDSKYLCEIIAKFLLLQPNATGVAFPTPGLSIEDNNFFSRDAGVSFKLPSEIFAYKKTLLKFLKVGFTSEDLLLPLLIAAADPSSAINDASEILLRKITIDYENPSFINLLVSLLIGSPERPPVYSTLQDKITQILVKSKFVTSHSQISDIATAGLSSENARLKQSAVQFIRWVSQNNSDFATKAAAELKSFNISMIAQLKENLMNEGWPQLDTTKVRSYVASIGQRLTYYDTIGNILKASPDLFLNDFTHIEFFFQSLEGESAEARSTIQDALSNLTVHLPSVAHGVKTRIKELAREYLATNNFENENIHSCRYIAIKYINSAFPFEDVEARYLCLLGTSKENRSDTLEEALRGLHPYWFNILQSSNTLEFKSTPDLLGENSQVEFPSFGDFVNLLYREMEANKSIENATILSALGKSINFGLQCLVMQSVKGKTTVIVPDVDWSVRLEQAVDVDETVRGLLIEQISLVSNEIASDNAYLNYLTVIFNAIVGVYKNVPEATTNIEIFTKLVTLSTSSTISSMSPGIPKLLGLLNGRLLNDVAISQIAKSIGIISSHPVNDDAAIYDHLNSLMKDDSPAYLLKGKILSISYLVSRLFLRKRTNVVSSEFLTKYCELLMKYIKDSSFYNVVLESLSQLAIFGVLGPTVNSSFGEYVAKFIEEIKPKVKKCDEKSVLAFASFSLTLADKSSDGNNDFEQLIYDTHISKQVEFTFSSGEAFVISSAGWQSKYLARQIDIQGESIAYIPEDLSRVPLVLDLILKSCANTKPSLRKASCIWLLSFVQYCGHIDVVQNRSAEIHVAFMRFLADKEELIQESASRGLSIVYEMGDHDLKDTLVRGLLKSFTDSAPASSFTSGSVQHDTELFEPELFKVSDTSVSTYKDVLNLASDVGDPSLVYKFMSLAKSSALWSSRKGVAFGLGSILSKTSLDELLTTNKKLADKLIPKLYRYRYDPNSSVQSSMTDIWNALVKDTSKTVKANFSIILEELLKSMGNKEWRVRQASAAGLNDLLQQTSIEVYESQMEVIWNMSFRIMDDIKDSVRKEGNKLTKTLATSLTRMIDVKNGGSKEKANEVLEELIPFLLGNKGLLSDSEDIKNFALETILKLCKIGGDSIKPFVPNLINNFINLMSALEPEAINYLILNADKYNLKNNDIDAKRLQSLGQSPMMDAIEKLMNSLDDSIMEEFVSKLESSIKRSVGLPSKVCASKVLVNLITKHYELAKPYGDKLLKISIQQLNDKNDTIASTFATASGYLCRVAEIPTIIAYSKKVNKLYFESEDDRGREIASVASECVSKYAGDKFELVSSAFLPLAFIGKFDNNKIASSNFEREWIENTSGSSNSIKLYIDEILEYLRTYINSNRFEIRKILGKSVSSLAQSVENLNQFPDRLIEEMITLLIEANKGKSWEGKELLLDSLVSFSVKAAEYLNSNNVLLVQVSKVVIIEAKRRNKVYQGHAIKLLGKFLHEFHNDETVLDTYIEIIDLVIHDKYHKVNENDDSDSDSDDPDAMDIDKSSISTKMNIEIEEAKLSYIKNLEETFYLDQDNEYNHKLLQFILKKFYEIFQSKLIENTWRSKINICEGLNRLIINSKFISKNSPLDVTEVELLDENCHQLLNECLKLDQIENVKIQVIRLAGTLIKLFNSLEETEKAGLVLQKLTEFKSVETSSVIITELTKVA